MIAVARNISYGAAYSEYATKKDKAVFIGAENMVGDWSLIFNNEQLTDVWLEFKDAGRDYVRKGKDVTRDLFVIECSPTMDESKNWSKSDWMKYAKLLLKEIDDVQLMIPKKDKKTNKWMVDESGKKRLFPVAKTELQKSKWMCMLHRDSESGIYHLHILISRYTTDNKLNENFDIAKKAAQASEKINQNMGWTKAMDIRQQHIDEINNVINGILADMETNSINWDDFVQRVSAATYKDYKGRTRNYSIQLHRNDQGEVDGYSVGRGKSTFKASELGQKLTKISATTQATLKTTVYDVLNNMNTPRFEWSRFVRELRSMPMIDSVEIRYDSKDNVVGYNVVFDGKKYNASQIGAKLTAKKISEEWERIQKEKEVKRLETVKHTEYQERKDPTPFIHFADVRPSIFFNNRYGYCIKVNIDGKEYEPKVLSDQHRRWYRDNNFSKLAEMYLAVHYYAKEIQAAQLKNYRELHYNAGKMPFGIILNDSMIYPDNMGGRFWSKGCFTLPNGEEFKESKEISRSEFVKAVNAKGADRNLIFDQLACRHAGDAIIKDFNPIPEISNCFAFESVDALKETVSNFCDISNALCGEFLETCGDAAVTYFKMMIPEGGVSVGVGGGGNNDLPRKKDDDDFFRQNGNNIMSRPGVKKRRF